MCDAITKFIKMILLWIGWLTIAAFIVIMLVIYLKNESIKSEVIKVLDDDK